MHDPRRSGIPFNVEAEDFDSVVVLAFDCLLPRIELLAFVDVLAASVTSPMRTGVSSNITKIIDKKEHTWKKEPLNEQPAASSWVVFVEE